MTTADALSALNTTILAFGPLLILGGINWLAFWTNQKFLYVVAAALDIIYGFYYGSTAVIPSMTFFMGLGIALIGLYIFIDRFVMRTINHK